MSDSCLELAEAQLREAKKKVYAVLPEIPVTIELLDSPEHTIPELGICGMYEKAVHTITIWIDPGHEQLLANLEVAVLRTFAHEYMHAYREQRIPWEGGSLLDCLIAEGLTQHFEEEVSGGQPPTYANALTTAELEAAWKRATPLLQKKEMDTDAWFFGNEAASLKRWTGYAIGYWLVEQHIERTGTQPSDLALEPSENFLQNTK